MSFDPKTVRYEKDGRTHRGDCPCSFCEETRRAFDKAAQRFQAEADKEKKDKKKK